MLLFGSISPVLSRCSHFPSVWPPPVFPQSLRLLITRIFGVLSGTTHLQTSCKVVEQLNLYSSQSYVLLLLAPEVSLFNILGCRSGCLWFGFAHHFFLLLFIKGLDFHLGNTSPLVRCGPEGTLSCDICPRRSG